MLTRPITGKTASMLDGPKTVLPLTHVPKRSMSMPNLHELKLLHNLKPRLLLLSVVAFLVFAGPALTLQSASKALVAEPPGPTSTLFQSSYVGAIESADCTKVTGWAEDPDDVNVIVSVDIYINGIFKATIPASRCIPIGSSNCHRFTYIIPSSLKNGQQLVVEVKLSATNESIGQETIRCGAMLFPGNPPGPVTSVSGEGLTWEQSVHLTSTESGEITHIRFWKVPEECGSHVGRIWSDTGTLLRSVVFPSESASGWQTAKLSSPLQITAGTKYRVSYNVNCYVGKIVLEIGRASCRERV